MFHNFFRSISALGMQAASRPVPPLECYPETCAGHRRDAVATRRSGAGCPSARRWREWRSDGWRTRWRCRGRCDESGRILACPWSPCRRWAWRPRWPPPRRAGPPQTALDPSRCDPPASARTLWRASRLRRAPQRRCPPTTRLKHATIPLKTNRNTHFAHDTVQIQKFIMQKFSHANLLYNYARLKNSSVFYLDLRISVHTSRCSGLQWSAHCNSCNLKIIWD